MIAKIVYFETGTKNVREAHGTLLFGDALLSDYIGVRSDGVDSTEGEIMKKYTLVPAATIIEIQTYDLDEDLYTIDIESMKRSKEHALRKMHSDMDRDDAPGGAFQ